MFDYYMDLVASLIDVGLRGEFDLGLFDLGLDGQQRSKAEAMGAAIGTLRWPITPPPNESGLEFFALAVKPYLRDFFPGYSLYIWMDADMWVQTADFWGHLLEPANRRLLAVPVESHSEYRRALKMKAWLFSRYGTGVGFRAAVRLMSAPLVNNALAALSVDAPHWEIWQREYASMVDKTGRLPGIDQLSLMSVIVLHRCETYLMPATDNWICSLCVPNWNPGTGQFVVPDSSNQAISVMHLTRPARGNRYSIRTTNGHVFEGALCRPRGHVANRSR